MIVVCASCGSRVVVASVPMHTSLYQNLESTQLGVFVCFFLSLYYLGLQA